MRPLWVRPDERTASDIRHGTDSGGWTHSSSVDLARSSGAAQMGKPRFRGSYRIRGRLGQTCTSALELQSCRQPDWRTSGRLCLRLRITPSPADLGMADSPDVRPD